MYLMTNLDRPKNDRRNVKQFMRCLNDIHQRTLVRMSNNVMHILIGKFDAFWFGWYKNQQAFLNKYTYFIYVLLTNNQIIKYKYKININYDRWAQTN